MESPVRKQGAGPRRRSCLLRGGGEGSQVRSKASSLKLCLVVSRPWVHQDVWLFRVGHLPSLFVFRSVVAVVASALLWCPWLRPVASKQPPQRLPVFLKVYLLDSVFQKLFSSLRNNVSEPSNEHVYRLYVLLMIF